MIYDLRSDDVFHGNKLTYAYFLLARLGITISQLMTAFEW